MVCHHVGAARRTTADDAAAAQAFTSNASANDAAANGAAANDAAANDAAANNATAGDPFAGAQDADAGATKDEASDTRLGAEAPGVREVVAVAEGEQRRARTAHGSAAECPTLKNALGAGRRPRQPDARPGEGGGQGATCTGRHEADRPRCGKGALAKSAARAFTEARHWGVGAGFNGQGAERRTAKVDGRQCQHERVRPALGRAGLHREQRRQLDQGGACPAGGDVQGEAVQGAHGARQARVRRPWGWQAPAV